MGDNMGGGAVILWGIGLHDGIWILNVFHCTYIHTYIYIIQTLKL